jgi:hypothetical protein
MVTYDLRLEARPPPPAVTLPLGVEARLGPADPSPFISRLRLGFLNLRLVFGGVDSDAGCAGTSTTPSILTSSSVSTGGTVRKSEVGVGGTSSILVVVGGGCGGESMSMLGMIWV